MKRLLKGFLFLFTLMSALLIVNKNTAGAQEATTTVTDSAITSQSEPVSESALAVNIPKKKIILKAGKKKVIKLTVAKEYKNKITVKSTKKKTATAKLSNNKLTVTAKEVGKCNIIVSAKGGNKATIKVTVKKNPQKVYFLKKSVTVKKNKTQNIKIHIDKEFKNRVKVKATKTNIAIIKATNKTIKFKALKKGNCKITASIIGKYPKNKAKQYKATITVKVVKKAVKKATKKPVVKATAKPKSKKSKSESSGKTSGGRKLTHEEIEMFGTDGDSKETQEIIKFLLE